jgi:tetratricopeptide (TPR) repeat protein
MPRGRADAEATSSPQPLMSGTFTEAGRIAGQFSPLQRAFALGRDPGFAPGGEPKPRPGATPSRSALASSGAAPARLSKTQAREAQRQAVRGARLAAQGQHSQALTFFRRSVELDPSSAVVFHDLGYACLQTDRLDEAAKAFGTAVRLKPDLASAWHYLAFVLDQLSRTREALVAYEAACRLEPAQQTAQFRLGQLYLGRERRAEAAEAFRAAAACNGDPVMARLSEAYARHALGDEPAAEALLRAVVAEAPEHAIAHLVLGEVMAQSGQTAEAALWIKKGIALAPHMVGAWHGYATNTKFTAADQPTIELIRAGLDRPDLSPVQRRSVYFALGKAFDDLGNYAEAMQHFEAGNRIRREAGTLDRATLAQQTSALIRATPPGYLNRSWPLGVADETPILIVGMPRSGTTLVEQILSSHPEVAAGGELAFWGDQNSAGLGVFNDRSRPEDARRIAEEYLGVLRRIAPEARRVTDKMPFNFGLLGIIRQVFPRAAIVHCRRHPVDNCLSIFCTDFAATIDFAADRGSLVFFYQQYQRLMAHWREVLSADRFIEIDYEALVADPEGETRRLVAGCGLAWDDACLAPHRNTRRITTASVWQARQPIYRTSVERWRRYEPWLGELRQLLPATEVRPQPY